MDTDHILQQKLPKHPNLTTCVGLKRFLNKDGNAEVLLLLEYCGASNLMRAITEKRLNSLYERIRCFKDVCDGVALLHGLDEPVVHLDLKVNY
jgi:AP2-associated kinase